VFEGTIRPLLSSVVYRGGKPDLIRFKKSGAVESTYATGMLSFWGCGKDVVGTEVMKVQVDIAY